MSADPRPLSQSKRESIDSVLAKNLLAARTAAGLTQQGLAEVSNISRATIAQLETGYSDPRLSTVTQLAEAIGVSPLLLLLSHLEATALVDLQPWLAANAIELPQPEVDRMRRLLKSGMLKDRSRVARLGAELANAAGHGEAAVKVGAAVLSALLPGSGTILGIALAKLLGENDENAS